MLNTSNPFAETNPNQDLLLKRNFNFMQQSKRSSALHEQNERAPTKSEYQPVFKENSIISNLNNPFSGEKSLLPLSSYIKDVKPQKQSHSRIKEKSPFDKQLSSLGLLNSNYQQIRCREKSESKQIELQSLEQPNNLANSTSKWMGTHYYKGLESFTNKENSAIEARRQTEISIKQFGVDCLRYKYYPSKSFQIAEHLKSEIQQSKGGHRDSQTSNYKGNHKREKADFNDSVSEYFSGQQSETNFGISRNSLNFKTENECLEQDSHNGQSKRKIKCRLKKKTSWGPGVSQKSSDYGDIPEDREQELGTLKNIRKYEEVNNQSDQILELPSTPRHLKRRSSIENFQANLTDEFGYSKSRFYESANSDMYQSGVNFNRKKKKNGPLQSTLFDDQSMDGEELYNGGSVIEYSDDGEEFPEEVEFREKLFFRIDSGC